MKKTFIYIMAAVAAIAAVSCNKIENEQASNVRTVTAGFDQETRTSLSGNSVSWEVDDVIKVMNEEGDFYSHTIEAGDLNNGKVSFTTTLTGQLYAIYGDTSASVPAANQISFTIPSSQSGAFKDAHICVAKLDANNHFAFKNATAIVKVEGSSELNYFSISPSCVGKMIAVFSGDDVSVSASSPASDFTMGNSFNSSQKWNDIKDKIAKLSSSSYYIAIAPGTYGFTAKHFSAPTSGNKVAVTTWSRSKREAVRSKIYTVSPFQN